MNKEKRHKSRVRLQGIITLILLLLALVMEAIMIFYWVKVLEPQLKGKAVITARALAQSQIHILADALVTDRYSGQREKVIKALDTMMLLSDPETGKPFILGVDLQVDYDVVSADEMSLDLKRGLPDRKDCFVTETPVYSKTTRELLGIARFYNSSEFYHDFITDVRFRLFFVSGFIFVGFLMALLLLKYLFKRAEEAEKLIKEQQAQLVHAGRITAMGEMATGIAHEINQPLTIIRLAADGLKKYFRGKDTAEMETEAAGEIVYQVERAADIINNMRSFVRMGSKDYDAIDLTEPCRRALSFFRERFRIHQIKFDIFLDKKLPKVKIDPRKFEQIIVNLLLNARYAVDEKEKTTEEQYRKKITVRLYNNTENTKVILEVEDNGSGMDKVVQNRCMEPFYTTKKVGEGTGLGLSIVHAIINELNMSMEIESEKGLGSRFRVEIKSE
jgi:signal transduction histidine kinase